MGLRAFGRSLLIGGLLALVAAMIPLVAGAQTASCYVVADAGGGDGTGQGGDAEDLLTRVDPSDHDPATNETSIGSGTGSFNVESTAFRPGSDTLYAVDGGRLGTLNLTTGLFSASANPIGSGSGSQGTVDMDNVDGLSFDPDTGALYGSQRQSGPDLLIRIDPDTGSLESGAFGADVDYVVVDVPGDLVDIDDLAITDDGTLYAVANDNGRKDRLVKINRTTGATTDVGPTGVEDMEGLTAAPGGSGLMGTTGKDAPEGEALWDINASTGAAGNKRPLDNGTDYEAVACPLGAGPAPSPTETEPGVTVSPTTIETEPGGAPSPGTTVGGKKIIAETGPAALPALAVSGLGLLLIGAAIMRLASPQRSE